MRKVLTTREQYDKIKRAGICKDCQNKNIKATHGLRCKRCWINHQEHLKISNPKRYINKSPEWSKEAYTYYANKLIEQDYKCAICKIDLFTRRKDRRRDHCHKYSRLNSKGWRGILCNRCNLTLGYIEEVTIENFAQYLKTYENSQKDTIIEQHNTDNMVFVGDDNSVEKLEHLYQSIICSIQDTNTNNYECYT